MKVNSFFVRHMSVNIFLEVLIGYFIAVLELSIVITLLLNGIIGQMNEPIPQVLQIEFYTGRPNVPVFIEVTLVTPKSGS